MAKTSSKLLFFAALFALLLGCISVGSDKLLTKPTEVVGLFDSADASCQGIGGPTPCTCLMCKNEILPFYLAPFVEESLKGGSCSFIPCNSEIFAQLIDKSADNQFPHKFLLGQGASFAEFKQANAYCSNLLTMSVKWMVGANEPPKIPAPNRAGCFLDRNVIPLYIYYTAGTAISQEAAAQIGAALAQADGPAIITTEINFDSSDAFAVSAVKSQILAYKAACPKCLVALSPKDLDFEGARLFLEDLSVKDKIDLIGQGIMLNENTNGICDVEALIGKRMEFSKRMLKEYNKPTIWLYVGIAAGTQDMEGNDVCKWENKHVAKAYDYMMGIMQPIISSGVIGYSPYAYSDGTAPLPCAPGSDACNFGLTNADFTPKEPQFSSWFSGCQYYTQEGTPSYVSFSTNGQGYQCTFGDNYKMFSRLISEAGDAYEPPTLSLQAQEIKIACDACVSYDTSLPSNFGSTSSSPSEYCTHYPQADIVPDRFDVPHLLMRAIYSQESSFDACAVSFVPPSTSACNAQNLGISAFSQYASDAGCTLPTGEMCVKTAASQNPSDPSENCVPCGSAGASSTRCKPCAFGLAQCIEYPGKEYAGSSLPAAITQCNGENYNPFNPSDSACCGATKMYDALQQARHIISLYPEIASSKDMEWYEAYLALMTYHGGQARTSRAVATYFSDGTYEDRCVAASHPTLVSFLRCVDSYPSSVLGKYQGLANACDTDCG